MRTKPGRVTSLAAARFEALVCLVRATTLLFGAAALQLADLPGTGPAVQFHVVVGLASALAVLPLSGARSAERVRAVAVASTVLDVALYAGYCAAFTGRPGYGSLYGVLVLLLGPLRWGLPGILATGLPVGLIALRWPVPDAAGNAPGLAAVVTLVLLLSLPVAGAAAYWRRSGARLRQAQLLFEAAFEHATFGMALLDARLVVRQGNHAMSGMLGVPLDALHGTALADWVDRQDRATVVTALRRLPTSAHPVRLEVRFARPDGETRWGLLAASWLPGSPGAPARVVAQVENVTDRKSAEERLAHQALHDDLTGLPNRSYLRVRLEHALATGHQPCVLFLDLDRFKVVNDGLGHAAGDRLLVEVAGRLQGAVRPGDVVARLGGDEFVVLVDRIDDEEQAVALGEHVLASLLPPVRLDLRTEVVVTASGGLARAGTGSTPDTLLRDADTAMYGAKAAGGNRVLVFTDELHHHAKRAQELEVDLRRALADGELALAYQPVLHLATGRVVESEALLRWRHPRLGDVSPAEFVPLAEQSGLIEDIGRWVLARAVADAVAWAAVVDGDAPGVAVNVSLRQLMDPGFPGHVQRVLDATGLAPSRLCLEVTETSLATDTAPLVPVLTELRHSGVRLAIDDFGTGHASLTYLAEFPVDVVKVDGTFVSGVATDAGSSAIVGGVVAMAHAFGLTVVAEGVETQAQLDALRRLGVDRAQGYLLARPMTVEALHGVLAGPVAQVPGPRTASVTVPGRTED